jgi:hypothetical protein
MLLKLAGKIMWRRTLNHAANCARFTLNAPTVCIIFILVTAEHCSTYYCPYANYH